MSQVDGNLKLLGPQVVRADCIPIPFTRVPSLSKQAFSSTNHQAGNGGGGGGGGGAETQFPSLMLYNLAIPHASPNAKITYIL